MQPPTTMQPPVVPPHMPPYAPPPGMPPHSPAPASGASGRTKALVGLAAVVLVAAVAAILVVLTSDGDTVARTVDRSVATTTESPATTVAATTLSPTTPLPVDSGPLPTLPTVPPPTVASTSPAPTLPSGGSGTLQATAAADRSDVQQYIQNRWVAQLSSKWIGLNIEGVTWDAASIMREHDSLRASYGAYLLYSSDWAFKRQDVWVTVTSTTFSSGAEANSWCVQQGIDAEHCFAKLIHTGAPVRGDTLNR
ncbi:MAG: hypothetical protein U0Q22_19700 [Acidimicrobiales bacterium]